MLERGEGKLALFVQWLVERAGRLVQVAPEAPHA